MKQELAVTNDLMHFVNSFLGSNCYKNGTGDYLGFEHYKRKVEERRVNLSSLSADSLSDQELTFGYFATKDVAMLLIEFSLKELSLIVDLDELPADIRDTYMEYEEIVIKWNSLNRLGADADERIEIDLLRTAKHTELTQVITEYLNLESEGRVLIRPPISRVLGRLILISRNLDTYERMTRDLR